MSEQHFPIGFSATGLSAGLSKKKNKKDMALFYSHLPANAGAVFTNNQVKAAPILLSQEHLMQTRGHARAVVVNSGSANAATGKEGLDDARKTVAWVAEGLKLDKHQVWTASTGVIGTRIDLKKYKIGLSTMMARLKKQPLAEAALAAEAIMTTDTVKKVASIKFMIDGVPVRMWGCCKGAGMIHPDMRGPRGQLHATMLGFILTDAAIKPFVIQRALERITDKTFNCVSVDGDTSTNDFVCVLANGASGAPEIGNIRGKNFQIFLRALNEICEKLTTAMAMDGEGASRLVHIFVEGARTEESARRMAAVISSSPLVKTACHGADPNWGRVLAAMGRSGVKFNQQKVRIWLGDILVCQHGKEYPFSEPEAISYMKNKRIVIRVDLGLGHKWARYKTCDFTGQYVGINAGYRT